MSTGVRRRMGVEERRQQLIKVALDLFSRRSPDEVSIDEIASAAGISRPLVYHYFPGKLSLYEAALKRASEDLAGRFVEPLEGPLGLRLLRVMRRFFDFVDEHGPGFSALMRGGPAVGSSATNALIDSVRQAAYEQILTHLGIEDAEAAPARLELVVRSWISLAESTRRFWGVGGGGARGPVRLVPPSPAAPGRPGPPPPPPPPPPTLKPCIPKG
ncbi:TetR/AcrR family transcriptional regulator [Streptomyces sp. NPDC059597]|uniref:TetR/AcrR family transcriptional regulator n=1 Tax=Streptomyces sp. NPDC059597 TaxID=3346879 RepID=UPI00368DAD84